MDNDYSVFNFQIQNIFYRKPPEIADKCAKGPCKNY